MKLRILADRNTLPDRFLLAEPGFSVYIEENGTNILFDTGYSDVFLSNAAKLGISVFNTDFVVLSNGRLNHSRGLTDLVKYYTTGLIEDINYKKPSLVTHPDTFDVKLHPAYIESGMMLTENYLSKHFELKVTRKPFMLSDNLFYLGEIPRRHDFEETPVHPKKISEGKELTDTMPEDSALVYKGKNGLVILTGSGYAGICNIIDYARLVCEEDKILSVIGGFNLIRPGEKKLNDTLRYLKSVKVLELYPTLTTDLKSKIALSTITVVKETGSGLALNY